MNPISLIFGAALVGLYFFMSRSASADTLNGVAGGATGGGKVGAVPFSEVTGHTYPGGGTSPLAFGLPGVQPGRGPAKPGATPANKGGGGIPSIPSSQPRGTPLGLPGRPAPIAPKAAPKPTPIPVRVAQGAYGVGPIPKGGVRRALL